MNGSNWRRQVRCPSQCRSVPNALRSTRCRRSSKTWCANSTRSNSCGPRKSARRCWSICATSSLEWSRPSKTCTPCTAWSWRSRRGARGRPKAVYSMANRRYGYARCWPSTGRERRLPKAARCADWRGSCDEIRPMPNVSCGRRSLRTAVSQDSSNGRRQWAATFRISSRSCIVLRSNSSIRMRARQLPMIETRGRRGSNRVAIASSECRLGTSNTT